MESYGGLTALQEAFLEHMRSVPFYGAVVACLDDANLRTLLPRVKRRIITYGFDSEADMTARNPRHSAFRSTYECVSKGQTLGEIELQVPGRHNIVNSLGAAAVGALLKLPFESTRHALRVFRGAERRMEWKGEKREVWVIDDYAHHPTEIRATLDACRLTGRRIVMVFQPHRFSRTRDLMSDLARCFEKAHRLFLLDIYSAGEKPIAGVTSQKLAQEIGRHREVTYVDDRAILLDLLLEETRPGDLLLTAGAGNVWQVGEEFLEQSH
jgi:UDP-N-acetylmuramate--alanine ligase